MGIKELSAYDIDRDYYYNFENGPRIKEFPNQDLKDEPTKIFDKEVEFPLGIPAGLLLNGNWVEAYNKLGYPIVVYKTVRTKEYPCQPHPNCLFVKTDLIDPLNPPDILVAPKDYEPECAEKVTITNSFGMPSLPPEKWQEDIDSLRHKLKGGSLLIGSGVGTFTGTSWELKRDFARVAAMLKEAGVDAVELNFSCPNVKDGEGSIYTDPDFSSEILKEVKKEIKDTPLVVKIGLLLGKELEEFVKKCSPYLETIAGINSFQVRVIREDGSPALGKGREKSGVCGYGIRKCAIEFTRQLVQLREQLNGDFLIFSCGGVTDRESYFELKKAGADAVLTCTGAMFKPFLSYEIRS
ncbi:dihydroorotate oxidase [Thermosulfidibacter takaii ABI70S6]|uniref:Dihydroorotate oxidase n=1 Tax=Thermosulfidibacter takaii (strain DSM 17441 / JCM 13301 / NBRC 103674 / ABI70S6) TaxID=1298851 RepID=A0A0S3QU98_THET7|nr:tRNA-dihydrouridine synthase [Thermosulfidibacter takaii]BAT71898.1 dihydroorotate oxidase [Thermosulfidibacter takaii ABI70S6]